MGEICPGSQQAMLTVQTGDFGEKTIVDILIAGCSVVPENQMSGLFDADAGIQFKHFLDHVTVAHRRPDHLPSGLLNHMIERKIAHHRGHKRLMP